MDQQLLVYTKDGVLANDGGTSAQGWQARLVSPPTHGAFVLNADGSFGYIPGRGFQGYDYFAYQGYDGTASTATVSVELRVGSVPAANVTSPIADPSIAPVSLVSVASNTPICTRTALAVQPDQYRVVIGRPVMIDAGRGVLANDGGTYAQGWSANLIRGPRQGQFALQRDGSFAYIPRPGFVGVDSFDYQATNVGVTSATVTVDLVVGQATVAPSTACFALSTASSEAALVTNPDTYTTAVGQLLLVYQNEGVLKNDGGHSGDGWTAHLVSGPSQGQLALNPDGSMGYVPPAGFVGVVTASYRVSYAGRSSDPVPITIYVGQLPVDMRWASASLPTPSEQDIVLVVAGQSNAAGFECSLCRSDFMQPLNHTDRMAFLNDPFAARLPINPHPPLGAVAWTAWADLPSGAVPIQDGTSRSFWPWVYDRLLTGHPRIIRSINLGVGDTFAFQWADPAFLNKRFDYAAAASHINFVLWLQGEGDALIGTSKSAYKAWMQQIKAHADNRAFAHLTVKPRWILFQTTGALPLSSDPNRAAREQIRQAMRELALERPSEFVLGADLDVVPRSMHFDTESQFDAAVTAIAASLRGYLF